MPKLMAPFQRERRPDARVFPALDVTAAGASAGASLSVDRLLTGLGLSALLVGIQSPGVRSCNVRHGRTATAEAKQPLGGRIPGRGSVRLVRSWHNREDEGNSAAVPPQQIGRLQSRSGCSG